MKISNSKFTLAQLDKQHTADLPERDLLIGASALGIPLTGADGVSVNVDINSPNWLFGSVVSV